MTYYLTVENSEIIGKSEATSGGDIIDVVVSKEIYDDFHYGENKYIYSNGEIIINPEWGQIQINKREEEFKKEFFLTSLGWIRRKPTLADGTEDDFLNNDLPLLAIGLMTGSNPMLPIAYQTPDFTQEFTKEYMESLQVKNQPVTQQFIAECSAVKMKDFTG